MTDQSVIKEYPERRVILLVGMNEELYFNQMKNIIHFSLSFIFVSYFWFIFHV